MTQGTGPQRGPSSLEVVADGLTIARASAAVDPTATGSVVASATRYITPVNRAAKSDTLAVGPSRKEIQLAALVFETPTVAPGLTQTAFALPEAPKKPKVVVASLTPTPARKPAPAADTASDQPKLLAYASASPMPNEEPFDAVMGGRHGVVLDANIDDAHAWLNAPLPTNVRAAGEVKCLATAMYFEARGEPEKGQIAVAQVVLNRLKNPAYPSTICNVVYQNKSQRNRCQFSFACDGRPDRVTDKDAWASAQKLARKVLNDDRTLYMASVGAATHYHATYVRPRWARKMNKVDKIGRHIFYETRNGGWS